ncbi:MAG: hypothetical protein EOP04_07950 [Proteobacteria bacterium]|nr:MAG: hypothetical protein EOP04_07950 [Pseudomonadota bacterium]
MTLEMAVQKVIRDWLASSKSRTLRSLSRKTGLSYATVRRMESAEVSSHPSTISKVLEVTLGTVEKVRGFMVEWMPTQLSFMSSDEDNGVFANLSNPDPLHVAIIREVTFENQTFAALEMKFGIAASFAIKELMDKKVLKIVDGQVRHESENRHFTGFAFAREVAVQTADITSEHVPGTVLHSGYDLMTQENYLEAYDLFIKFRADIEKLRNKPSVGPKCKKIAFSINMTQY